MNINDIDERLARLYDSIDEQYQKINDDAIVESLIVREDGIHELRMSFGNNDPVKNMNKIMNVVHAIASLKDHIKDKLAEKYDDPKKYEDYINSNEPLALITDIDNQDKHTTNLKHRRTKHTSLRIDNIHQALRGVGKTSFSVTKKFNEPGARVSEAAGDLKIIIVGDILDNSGQFITTVDSMITSGIQLLEDFIEQNSIGN